MEKAADAELVRLLKNLGDRVVWEGGRECPITGTMCMTKRIRRTGMKEEKEADWTKRYDLVLENSNSRDMKICP